jgi:hypothetical protein
MLSSYNRGGSQQNVSSSSSLSYHKKRSKIKNFGANNNDYIYPDNAIINSLDIADGLKELSISDLAEYLGIDLYVANIISNSAKKLSRSNDLEERITCNNNAILY